MADSISDKIDEIAKSGVESMTVDGATTKRLPIPDMIAAEDRKKSRTAAGKNHFGLHFRKIKPPGGGL